MVAVVYVHYLLANMRYWKRDREKIRGKGCVKREKRNESLKLDLHIHRAAELVVHALTACFYLQTFSAKHG